ncbi:hypothetical protein [Micromonospora peucetia]|uniref:Major Facilitator Superfamily protein n=1 Tax=Micromonospora peucetia TaxID=47871 RepID=A0ABZ1E973_9ACTN|nr:hypothetical protein [Micromonospora peucetia]WSA30364.1 hypothetical protein OIE14_19385 [Micromonospora peucetia]
MLVLLGGAFFMTMLDGASLLTIALLVFGAGMGTATVCAQIAAFTGVAERDSGLADTCFAVGTALGVAIAAALSPRTHPRLAPPRRRRWFPVSRPRSAWSASSRHWAWSSL